MRGREVSFEINKYKKPVLLSKKESLVQLILNALFMVPGNEPGNPKAGVNIERYLYKPVTDSDGTNIEAALKQTCGSTLTSTILKSCKVTTIETEHGPAMVLAINVVVDDDDDTLAIILQKQQDRVHLNYKFMKEIVDVVGR